LFMHLSISAAEGGKPGKTIAIRHEKAEHVTVKCARGQNQATVTKLSQ
jgi:hypothetical protein